MMKKTLILTLFVATLFILTGCQTDKNDDTCPPTEAVDLSRLFPLHGNYYQLFVRSFADSSGDGVGDFIGIAENLDYFEELGIDGLWLMPIHPTNSKHGYDVIDFYDVNPEYGTMADFEFLLDAANERGITIIIDYVLNHTATNNPWFEAFLAGEAPYDEYYRRITANDNRHDKRGAWGQQIWHPISDGTYYAGYFGGYMPDLNWSNPAVQDEMLDVALFWMEKGVGGFRLDAALHLQAPGEVPEYYRAFDETLNELRYFEVRLKEQFPDAYIVGEIWDDFSVYNHFYKSLDSPLHFDFGHLVVNSVNRGHGLEYVNTLVTWHERANEMAGEVNRQAVEAPFLRNHDQNRLASANSPGSPNIGDRPDALRLAAEMLLTVPGNPFLYYGEELGMKGEASGQPPIWDESIRLPMLFDNEYRTTWPEDDWGYVDPFNQDVDPVSVQREDTGSLFNTYKSLLNLRRNSLALRYGTISAYEQNNHYLQGFYRILDIDADHQDRVLVLHNLDSADYPLFDHDLGDEILYYSGGAFDNIMAPRSTLIVQLPFADEGSAEDDE